MLSSELEICLNEAFQSAIKRKPQNCPPIWMMRQAGRYHKHYQALRAKHGFMDLCKNAELASEVALGPVTAVAVVAGGSPDTSRTPLPSGEAVEALIGVTLASWKPSAEVLRACVDLVGGIDGFRIADES